MRKVFAPTGVLYGGIQSKEVGLHHLWSSMEVQQNSLFGPATTTSESWIDLLQPGTHVRTICDLKAHTDISWDARLSLIKEHPIPAVAETVNGVSVKAFEFVMESATGKSKGFGLIRSSA